MDNLKQERTPLTELGEFELIKRLTSSFKPQNPSTIISVGDDAAVLQSEGKQMVVSTDLLMEGVHFNLSYHPLKHLGYKSVMVNLSDIYAMNAIATQITVSIAVSNRFPLESLEEIYKGIQMACETYKVDLVGGDTSSSQKGLLMSVTAMGFQESSKITPRTKASPNDLLVVTGDLGAAYLGFQILERERQVFEVNPNSQPDLKDYSYLVERQLKPEARKDIIKLFEQLKLVPTSMIDISDGLSSEVLHLCEQSKVGCTVYEEKIPLDPQTIKTCEELDLNSTVIALSGGEDYELLFTVSQKDYDKIKGNPNFTIIGHINKPSEGKKLMTRGGQQLDLKAQGWNALSEN